MRKGLIFTVLLLSMIGMAGFGSAYVEDPPVFLWHQFTLSNGLRVLLQPDPKANEISIEFWILAGIHNEALGKFGLAHFAEHALPYGLQSDTAARSLLRSMMTNSNAQTRKDYTRYYIQVKPEGLELGLRYAAERFRADTSTITDEIIERHRKNVLAELERNSSNSFWGYSPVTARESGTFGRFHPYGHSGYGTPEENRNFTVHDVRVWYDRFISPQNAILFLVGNFDPKIAHRLIEQEFGGIPAGMDPGTVRMISPQHSASKITIESPSTHHTLSLTWALPQNGLSDEPALRIAASLIGRRLKNTKALPSSVRDVGSQSFMNRYKFAGQFGVALTFSALEDSAEVERFLRKTVIDVVRSGVSEKELQLAREDETKRIREMTEELGFIGSRTELLGEGMLFTGNPDHYFAQIKQQSALTNQDVQAVVQQWLTREPFRLLAVSIPQRVSIPTKDGGNVSADIYGTGSRGVVLVHGGRFTKKSWESQARTLVEEGFRVSAIDLRGVGESTGPGQSDPYSAPFHHDVLAAVRFLRSTGSKTVSVIGASMGGWAAADASISSEPGEIDRIVILAASIDSPPEKLKGRTLFIVAGGDTTASGIPRLVQIRKQYERAPQPKELVILDGSAHAQFVFQTSEGDRLMREIVRFLIAP